MIRAAISLVIAGGLFAGLAGNYQEIPLSIKVAIGLFGLIFSFVAIASVKHHRRLLQARQTQAVAVTIYIRATPARRGPDSLVAEILVGQDTWRGILTAWKPVRALANQTHEGLAWIHPSSGAPLEIEIEGQIITPVPVVVKVDQNSKLERVIRKVHDFD